MSDVLPLETGRPEPNVGDLARTDPRPTPRSRPIRNRCGSSKRGSPSASGYRRRVQIALVFALVAALLVPTSALAFEALVPVVRIGPWPAVSALVGYGSRLWFVNSLKFADHNSADVYSYDPRTSATRYERHLFSQDAGDPVVADGLLYWPFEDGRFSTGRGEYAVTNGREWQWRILPAGEVFHVHAMATHSGALFAATGAWRAGLQRSDDGGLTWRVIWDRPTPPGLVSRLTKLAVLDGVRYAGLTAWHDHGAKLLRLDRGTPRPLAGWPPGGEVTAMAAYRGWLYAVNGGDDGQALWRTDGRRVERARALDRVSVRALAATPDALWAVSAVDGDGALWRSADGTAWSVVQRFAGAEPIDVAAYAGRVYVGTRGPGGRGTLWGPSAPAPVEPSIDPHRLPGSPRSMTTAQPPRALDHLDRVLADPTTYSRGAAALVAALQPLASSRLRETGVALVRRLDGPFPATDARVFGGAVTVPAATFARWYLLWALAVNGHGHVPLALLAAPWAAAPNRPEKYFEPIPAAAWAAAELGQADDETLAALIARLGVPGDPAWLTGDVVGTLTALTGERFGYDVDAWRRWWTRRGRHHPRRRHAPGRRSRRRDPRGRAAMRRSRESSDAAFVTCPRRAPRRRHHKPRWPLALSPRTRDTGGRADRHTTRRIGPTHGSGAGRIRSEPTSPAAAYRCSSRLRQKTRRALTCGRLGSRRLESTGARRLDLVLVVVREHWRREEHEQRDQGGNRSLHDEPSCRCDDALGGAAPDRARPFHSVNALRRKSRARWSRDLTAAAVSPRACATSSVVRSSMSRSTSTTR